MQLAAALRPTHLEACLCCTAVKAGENRLMPTILFKSSCLLLLPASKPWSRSTYMYIAIQIYILQAVIQQRHSICHAMTWRLDA